MWAQQRVPDKLGEITVWNTGECNFSCKYCYERLWAPKALGRMDLETAEALWSFAHQNVVEGGGIWFFGGEPTVNWEVIKFFVEKNREEGNRFRLGMTTNMLLLNEEKVKYLASSTDRRFGVLASIDGLKAQHDRNRVLHDGSGTWYKVMENLQHVRKHLNPNPQIRWTYTPETLEGIADAVKVYVEEYGLTNLALGAVFETEWDESDWRLFRQEMVKLRGYIIEWSRKGVCPFLMPVRDGLSLATGGVSFWDRCGLGQGSVGVSPKGVLSPCHRLITASPYDEDLNIGDVHNGFNENRLKWIRRWYALPPISEDPSMCRNCIVKPICWGGCIAMNYDMFGDPHVIPSNHCRYMQIVTETFLPLAHMDLPQAFRQAYRIPPTP